MPRAYIDEQKPHANARAILRAATTSHHQRVDDTFSAYALSDPASYRSFLRAQARAHLPIEHALDAGGIVSIVPDWAARRRNAGLHLDLAELGLEVPLPVGTLALRGDAALLGALYVLEGSRLGGTLLRRSVAPGLPTRFLAKVDPAAWHALLLLLDTELNTDERLGAAIEAAREVFDLFDTSGRSCSEL